MAQPLPRLFALALALALAPAGALAKEESKIQVLLLEPGSCPGNGGGLAKGQGPIGAVRSFLQNPGDKATLQLHVRGLAPSREHTLVAFENSGGGGRSEIASFETGSNGRFVGSFDLHKGAAVAAPTDPRGKYLVVEETGGSQVLAGWLYGAPEDDCPMTKVKELTRLAPPAEVDPSCPSSGSVDARYEMRPNGNGSLLVQLRGVPPGDYEISVEGAGPVATLTPNAGGNAQASFQTKPSNGNGNAASKGHNKRGDLGFDPRRKQIDIELGGHVCRSGQMLAQIEGLNVCSASTTPLTLVLPAGSGTAALEVELDCETALEITANGLAEGAYHLRVDGVDVADLPVALDGLVAARFDPTPDLGEDELELDFDVTSASTIELVPVF